MREWLEQIDPNLVDLFPLQFANCERLKKHDALFIFDEVGSGKTITSGLMALDFLEAAEQDLKSVLIITTKTLVTGENNGQFLNDWYSKLPFKELGYDQNITIINNHCLHLERIGKSKIKKYGLIIIDEAHLFLSKETRKHEALKKIKSEKVVFLTATPIKKDETDLEVYTEIANEILGKKISKDWIYEINTLNKSKQEILSATFNLDLPVTRYFKDTIQSLLVKEFKKEDVKRHETVICEITEDSSNLNIIEFDALKSAKTINFIKNRLIEFPESRFVIFFRYKREAEQLKIALENEKFTHFLIQNEKYCMHSNEYIQSYAIVNGDNTSDLQYYSNKNKSELLPTVLALSFQIGEQGVNLPGFNHVINYHIPAFPSAIEQRYGRIDRLSKKDEVSYKSIYNCFILPINRYFDSSLSNFYRAIYISVNNLLKYLPSRNTLLSKKLLNKYLQESVLHEKKMETLKKHLDNKEDCRKLYNLLKNEEDENLYIPEKLQALFVLSNRLEDFDFTEDENNFSEFIKSLSDVLTEATSDFSEKGLKAVQILLEKMDIKTDDGIWDHIFYKFSEIGNENLTTLNPIDAATNILNPDSDSLNETPYVEYTKILDKELEPHYFYNKYKETLDKFFYNAFKNNEFEILLPITDDKSYEYIIRNNKESVSKIYELQTQKKLSQEDFDKITQNINRWITNLPIFTFFKYFQKAVANLSKRKDSPSDQPCSLHSFYSNPFVDSIIALKSISKEHYKPIYDELEKETENLQEWEYYKLLLPNYIETYPEIFLPISKYLKLLYYVTRKEVCSYNKNFYDIEKEFKELEDLKIKMLNLLYQKHIPLEIQILFEENTYQKIPYNLEFLDEEFFFKYNQYVEDYDKLNKTIRRRDGKSIFRFLIFRSAEIKKEKRREWVKNSSIEMIKVKKVQCKDYWTSAILNELDYNFLINKHIPID